MWSDDVDLADGKVQKMHDAYLKRLREINHVTGEGVLRLQPPRSEQVCTM